MSSAPWSEKGEKDTTVDDDEFMIIDSEDSDPTTTNKRVKKTAILKNVSNIGFQDESTQYQAATPEATEELPPTISPSTAIFSPGLTTRMSPSTTSSMGMSTSSLFLTTRAVLGRSPMSLRMASEVCPLARASRSLPNRTREMTMAEASK